MICKDLNQQFVGRLLELVDYSVVQRILILFQPTGDIVRYLSTGNVVVIFECESNGNCILLGLKRIIPVIIGFLEISFLEN